MDPAAPTAIAVVDGPALTALLEALHHADATGRPARLTVNAHGVQVDPGNGWSTPLGRAATATGH